VYTPEHPPTQAAYRAALESILGELKDTWLEVLHFQFSQPNRSVTSQDIRDHFQYGGIGGANLLYGTLACRLAKALPMATDTKAKKRPQYWKAISTGDGSGEHFIWIMRPELAGALIELHIVDPNTDGHTMVPDVDIHATSFSAGEGRKKLVLHLTRERNPALVKSKKQSMSSWACEVCHFDFNAAYGIDYCEAHHLVPLAQLDAEAETTLDMLVLLCANCHRIAHLRTPPYELSELRSMIERHN
jgi:predicted HNH restriction endonuclease